MGSKNDTTGESQQGYGAISDRMPVEPGRYQIKCSETEGEWEEVVVSDEQGVLLVNDPLLGTVGLKEYHNGLIDLRWRRCD